MELMVPVKNGEIWADDTGGDGPPLVLLHPGIADSDVWDAVVPTLARHHRVIRYDARGYGRSPAPTAAYSQAEDLAAVLGHLGLERAALAGTSMGGATAINLALDTPDRVTALALVCPGVTGCPELTSPALTDEIGALARAGDMDGLVALALRTWAAAGTPPDTEAAGLLRRAIPAWFSTYPHQVADAPAYDRLGELRQPSLVVVAGRDQPEVVRCNEEMATRIPGCRLERLPDCDHLPTLRDPQTVARLILEVTSGTS
ncbi:alpha/beta fold hydrolase [Streptomyces sp. AV19]|uniref:alpha/beta fold hydrolase n=1 Tax=Streptomyces sp. AV19 TaxID=2793068 RepID=UPI0018FEEC6F|nr:alpha/beta fold hydrolase [Streptomyces sp. AV19]MBH1938754.1 alpha/beta fold hydrolase [Streptomyces sp. AV19]MDG4533971.1 alpha/beta hydrolase [Streptomyces sp. AV19]